MDYSTTIETFSQTLSFRRMTRTLENINDATSQTNHPISRRAISIVLLLSLYRISTYKSNIQHHRKKLALKLQNLHKR